MQPIIGSQLKLGSGLSTSGDGTITSSGGTQSYSTTQSGTQLQYEFPVDVTNWKAFVLFNQGTSTGALSAKDGSTWITSGTAVFWRFQNFFINGATGTVNSYTFPGPVVGGGNPETQLMYAWKSGLHWHFEHKSNQENAGVMQWRFGKFTFSTGMTAVRLDGGPVNLNCTAHLIRLA